MPAGNNRTQFMTSVHGPDYEGSIEHVMTCQSCHAGAADFTFGTMEEAHAGMYADPSAPGQAGCQSCHADDFSTSACDGCHAHKAIAEATANSLHTNLWGYKAAIENRCGCEFASQGEGVQNGFQANCAGCHTTCGQCHVSRPKSVGSGFPFVANYYSHRFRRSPHMTEQCTACHGSRVGHDYLGEFEGNDPDVHWGSNSMTCTACHDGEELHGDDQHAGDNYEHRYEVATMPRCEECHEDDLDEGFGHIHHTGQDADCSQCHSFQNHPATGNCSGCHDGGFAFEFAYPLPTMQCQVCHSQPYKNCTNCHDLANDGKQLAKYQIEPSVIDLKIGNNPSPHRDEYDYSLVRHVPVSGETYSDWGLDLPDYLDFPTWKYTSPHNIRERTAQTDTDGQPHCYTACHGTQANPSAYLLREADLHEGGDPNAARLPDYDANIGTVIREEFPGQ